MSGAICKWEYSALTDVFFKGVMAIGIPASLGKQYRA